LKFDPFPDDILDKKNHYAVYPTPWSLEEHIRLSFCHQVSDIIDINYHDDFCARPPTINKTLPFKGSDHHDGATSHLACWNF
jgi:hypothetical protein